MDQLQAIMDAARLAGGWADAQSAYGWVVSQTVNIETEVYKTVYPEADYASILPVVTEGNPWASGTMFYTQDIVGSTKWLGNDANDLPYTELLRDSGSRSFYARGNAYKWTLMEVNRALMLPGGGRLTADKADGARMIAERAIYDIAVSGASEKGWDGFIDYTGVTDGDVAADSALTTTWWTDKTDAQIIRDIRVGFDGIGSATKWTITPDTLAVPPEIYSLLATRVTGVENNQTLLRRIQSVFGEAYNVNFRVVPIRQLTTADAGGDGRGILYKNSRDVVRLHLPRPYGFLNVFQKDSFTFEQAGLFITGGTEIRQTKAVYYLDGIYNAP